MNQSSRAEVSAILIRAASGTPDAIEELYPLVYENLRARAGLIMAGEGYGHTLQPTALVNEAYLKLARQDELKWKDRAHFLAIAARAMRQVLVDHSRAKKRMKRGGDIVRVSLAENRDAAVDDAVGLLELEDAICHIAAMDVRKGRVCELKLFGDLTFREVGEVLEISAKTAEADWYFSRAWLRRELR